MLSQLNLTTGNTIALTVQTFAPIDRSSKHKVNKETQALKDTLYQMNLLYIFRIVHPNTEEYTFFSSGHKLFSRIVHILGHKLRLGKFKKTEVVSSIFSDHNTMKVDIN